jgi:hypothetical protein
MRDGKERKLVVNSCKRKPKINLKRARNMKREKWVINPLNTKLILGHKNLV